MCIINLTCIENKVDILIHTNYYIFFIKSDFRNSKIGIKKDLQVKCVAKTGHASTLRATCRDRHLSNIYCCLHASEYIFTRPPPPHLLKGFFLLRSKTYCLKQRTTFCKRQRFFCLTNRKIVRYIF